MALLFIPEWLSSEKYLTLATWGLVVATLLLVVDSFKKGREQRERWRREDERYDKQTDLQMQRWNDEAERLRLISAPHCRFGLEVLGTDLGLWCANLGTTTFVLQKVVTRFSRADQQAYETVKIVPAGKLERVALDSLKSAMSLGEKNIEVWLCVGTSEGVHNTESEGFTLMAYHNSILGVQSGLHEQQTIKCQACEKLGIFKFTDVSSLDELDQRTEAASSALSASCPKHIATGLCSLVSKDSRVERIGS